MNNKEVNILHSLVAKTEGEFNDEHQGLDKYYLDAIHYGAIYYSFLKVYEQGNKYTKLDIKIINACLSEYFRAISLLFDKNSDLEILLKALKGKLGSEYQDEIQKLSRQYRAYNNSESSWKLCRNKTFAHNEKCLNLPEFDDLLNILLFVARSFKLLDQQAGFLIYPYHDFESEILSLSLTEQMNHYYTEFIKYIEKVSNEEFKLNPSNELST